LSIAELIVSGKERAMKRFIFSGLLSLMIAVSLASSAALADSRQHHAAIKLCKQKYKDAVRGAKYLKGHQRRARIAEAQREREECKRLAPK
jgi:hypothetical protein